MELFEGVQSESTPIKFDQGASSLEPATDESEAVLPATVPAPSIGGARGMDAREEVRSGDSTAIKPCHFEFNALSEIPDGSSEEEPPGC